MKTEILRCPSCSTFTLERKCSICDTVTVTPKPAKFSLEDKYGKYRRMAKEQQ